MRVGQAKRLFKALIIADSALEIVEDTPQTCLEAISEMMEQKVLKYHQISYYIAHWL